MLSTIYDDPNKIVKDYRWNKWCLKT
jgi:hypothetical protein